MAGQHDSRVRWGGAYQNSQSQSLYRNPYCGQQCRLWIQSCDLYESCAECSVDQTAGGCSEAGNYHLGPRDRDRCLMVVGACATNVPLRWKVDPDTMLACSPRWHNQPPERFSENAGCDCVRFRVPQIVVSSLRDVFGYRTSIVPGSERRVSQRSVMSSYHAKNSPANGARLEKAPDRVSG